MFLKCIRTGANLPMIKLDEVYHAKSDFDGNTVIQTGVFEICITHKNGVIWESRGENAAFKEVGSDL